MADPLMSVILPARNEERLLPAALRSVREQTLDRRLVEAIVVSNGSTDGTLGVAHGQAEEAAQADGLAIEILGEGQPGIARAKNLGAGRARGRLLIFMDADSWMSPGLLETVRQRAEEGERAASIRIVADGEDPIDHAFFWVIENGKRLVRTRANMFWCERSLFERLGGFDESLNHAEDLDFLVRVHRAGVRVGHIRDEWIATSPRRLHRGPLRAGMFTMLGRWVLGRLGIGRRWPYSGGGP
ncbi:MAG TPA: glycosyltransferase family A protein [Candidatus Limnocylindria bacterium]